MLSEPVFKAYAGAKYGVKFTIAKLIEKEKAMSHKQKGITP